MTIFSENWILLLCKSHNSPRFSFDCTEITCYFAFAHFSMTIREPGL